MDQTWEILGLIVAVLMVITGLRLLLKKPQTLSDASLSELPINAQSQQPVVPRHLRQFAVQEDHSEVINDSVSEVPVAADLANDSESSFADRQQQFDFDAVEAEPQQQVVPEIEETQVVVEQQIETTTVALEEIQQDAVLHDADDRIRDNQVIAAVLDEADQPVEETIHSTDIDTAIVVEPTVVAEPEYIPSEVIFVEQQQTSVTQRTTFAEQNFTTIEPDSTAVEPSLTDLTQMLNDATVVEQQVAETASIDEVVLAPVETTVEQEKMVAVDMVEQAVSREESNILDAHLSEQNRQDEESVLATAAQLVALYLYPSPKRALSGEKTLKMLIKYGLRYGEMSCFHRYEDNEQSSPLMFSVLRISDDGAPTGFDLEALSSEEVKGLAFFLALPNANAIKGFDMMVSLAGLMARDVDGILFDEQALELTPQLRDHWRHFVIEYKPE